AYDQILAFHPALEPLLKPLELKPGLSLLDLGSGPGHTTLELARRVRPNGRVVGVDINREFVRRSTERARAEKLPAEFVESPFPPLKFADDSFDRVFCKNVLEYVDSAAATVAEMARVAAKDAIVVAIDSDWEMIALDIGAAARERSDRMLAAAKSIAIKEPKIGRLLYGLFVGAGLTDVKVGIMAGADTQGRALPMLRASLARYARDSGRVAPADVDGWLDDINRAIESRTFLFALPQFVVRGIKQ
ncbi:MAG: methyltransferase domain-containing protein, partial [Candidatus Binataceae bacterium]